MQNITEHVGKGAHLVASLLAPALREAEQQRRHLYNYELEAIEWLREQCKQNPETWINSWVAERYVLNSEVDLFGRMSSQ